jgi:hypothetical protein
MRPPNLAEPSNATDRFSLRGRSVALRINPSRMRRVHQEIVTRLASEGAHVSVELVEQIDSLPAAVDLLFELERIIYRLRGLRPSDRCAWDDKTSAKGSPDSLPDLIFDLSGGERIPASPRVIRPLYDGIPGEAALIGALTAGRMPIIDLEDTQAGVLLARGAPCADNAPTILEAFDCALARLATLVIAVARGRSPLIPAAQSTPTPLRLRDAAVFEGKSLARSLVRRLYYMCCYARIGGPAGGLSRGLISWIRAPSRGRRGTSSQIRVSASTRTRSRSRIRGAFICLSRTSITGAIKP